MKMWCSLQPQCKTLEMVTYTFNPSNRDSETDGSLGEPQLVTIAESVKFRFQWKTPSQKTRGCLQNYTTWDWLLHSTRMQYKCVCALEYTHAPLYTKTCVCMHIYTHKTPMLLAKFQGCKGRIWRARISNPGELQASDFQQWQNLPLQQPNNLYNTTFFCPRHIGPPIDVFDHCLCQILP